MTENEEKIYLQGKVSKKVYDEFVNNIRQVNGYKKGRMGLNLESALKLFNNYCKPYKNKLLIEMARENNRELWEIGEYLLKMYVVLYAELGCKLYEMSPETHYELVKKYLSKRN